MQTTIKVLFVNQPKPGKKKGSIKGDDGNYYGVWPDKLSLFQKGEFYTIEYTENNGFKDFQKIVPGAPSANGNGKHDDKALEIFVTGVIGRCFQGTSQLPDQKTLTDIVRHLRTAWQEGMKPTPGDAIPEEDGAPF